MVFEKKNKLELLYKQFTKLKKNVQNKKVFLEFKKQKCEKLVENYKQKPQRYSKFKQLDWKQCVAFRYIKQEFLHKKYFKKIYCATKKLELLQRKNQKISEQFVTFKVLQTIENTTKTKTITPVVTEDIVAYLLRNVDEKNKFSKLYKFIVSEENLIAASFETENKSSLNNGHRIFSKFPLQWFQKTSELLMLGKYNYKSLRVVSLKKKNTFQKLILTNLYDIIIRKAFHRVLNVIFEGYFEWKKTDKKTFQTYSLKKQTNNEYWVKSFKIQPIFSSMSYGFRLKKGVHSAIRTIEKSWYFNLCATYQISPLWSKRNTSVFVKNLQKYINDKQLIEQIEKMLNTQITHLKLNSKDSVLDILSDNVLFPLFFNIYLHPLDEFMSEVIKNVPKLDKKKSNLKYEIAKQNEIGLSSNSKLTPARIYFARFMNEFLLGFFIPKIQIKLIMNDVTAFITDNLKLKMPQKNLKHAISDKISFLGFNIRIILSKNSKCFKKKSLEVYKRHKNTIIRKGAQEHEKFLKMIEWLGRKAISSIANQSIILEKSTETKTNLEKKIPLFIKQENWFYSKHKSNKKMELAFKNRAESQQHKFKRWIKANQDLINSREMIELSKIIGEEYTEKLRNIRENMTKLLEEIIGTKAEKAYVFKTRSVKQNSIKNNDVSLLRPKFDILFPKKKIMEELKNENIINSRGMPSAVMLRTTLLDSEIIDWYTILAKGLLLYYECTSNFIDLKRLVNWTLRYSLFATLGAKHKKSTKWTINTFGFDPKVLLKDKTIAHFPTASWINSRRKKYTDTILNHKYVSSIIYCKYIKSNQRVFFTNKCGSNACDNIPDHIYYVERLNKIWKGEIAFLTLKTDYHTQSFQKALQSVTTRKWIPLCDRCYNKMYQGILTIEDLDEKCVIIVLSKH